MFTRSSQSFALSLSGIAVLSFVALVFAADGAAPTNSTRQAQPTRTDDRATIGARAGDIRQGLSNDVLFSGRAAVSRTANGLWTLDFSDDGSAYQFSATPVSGDLRDETPVEGATSLRFISADQLSIVVDASFANNVIIYDVLLQLDVRDARWLNRAVQAIYARHDQGAVDDDDDSAASNSDAVDGPNEAVDDADASDDADAADGPPCNSCKCRGSYVCTISCPPDLAPKCDCAGNVCSCVAWPRPY